MAIGFLYEGGGDSGFKEERRSGRSGPAGAGAPDRQVL